MPIARRGVLLLVLAGSLAFASGRSDLPPPERYSSLTVEHYLTAEEAEYVRPGLNITVNSITIPADLRPIVDLTLKDDLDQPLDRLGRVTPGPISLSFILAWWNAETRDYTAYTVRTQTSPITGNSAIQASADSGGTFTDVALGRVTYRFRTALPADFDMTKTHTLGIYSRRSLTDIIGKDFFDNVEHDFRPDMQPVTEFWDAFKQDQTCNTCHNPISAHGEVRRDVKLCVLCHSPQTIDPDTGNTVDFPVMIHKIHRGENLPSVQAGTPYIIIGNQQSVHDFSDVVFPQDIRNCDKCHLPGSNESHIWFTRPSRAVCGSCHDNVDWVTGANHPAGPQLDDTACASCHVPEGDHDFDASIRGAHTVPYEARQLRGLHAEILSVTNTAPGERPVVRFKITEDDGTVLNPAPFGSNLNILLGGPTKDYDRQPFRERASGATFDGQVATYTFTNAIPANAVGSWAVSIEARRTVVLDPGGDEQQNFTEGAVNPVVYVAVTDTEPVPRKMVVELARCNLCHDVLRVHGGQRLHTQECVICHNPNANDASRRPTSAAPAESISFERMIHRIHTGEELTQDYTVYGFFSPPNPPNPITFNHLRFPGDRRDCETCHLPGTYTLPLSRDQLPVETLRDYYSPQGPASAACLGCHDNIDAAAHAFINTAPFAESCATCHGNNAEFSVQRVHAR